MERTVLLYAGNRKVKQTGRVDLALSSVLISFTYCTKIIYHSPVTVYDTGVLQRYLNSVLYRKDLYTPKIRSVMNGRVW